MVDNKNAYLDLEEGYRDLNDFFSNQLQTWQQLQQALAKFDINKQMIERDTAANTALLALQAINASATPYGELHKVAALISTVETIIAASLKDKRAHALARVDEKISQLQTEIAKSTIGTPELSNSLLYPLQQLKVALERENSLATIYMLQSQTATERFDDSLAELEGATHAATERKRKAAEEAAKLAAGKTALAPDHISEPQPVIAPPKPIVEVSVSAVFAKSNGSVYLESMDDVTAFVQALTDELKADINLGKRIRIR